MSNSKTPLVLAYGMGVDSTAVLVEWYNRRIRPDLILHADVGSEKPATYAYLPIIQWWLASVGFPPVIVVKYVPTDFKHWPPYRTLGENCFTNGTLPSLAFGFKSCSQKWKIGPQEKYTSTWQPAIDAWKSGAKLVKAIGYDAGPADTRRYVQVKDGLDPKYDYIYPLRDWGWDRARCKEEIAKVGLPVPAKSACYFCPATQPEELHELPEFQLRGIVAMEARAAPRLTEIKGLWRNGIKGTRKPERKRPAKMTDYIREKRLLPPDVIDQIVRETPADLLEFQEAYAEGKVMDELSAWMKKHNISS